MKNLSNIIVLVLTIVLFASCQQEELTLPQEETTNTEFVPNVDIGTSESNQMLLTLEPEDNSTKTLIFEDVKNVRRNGWATLYLPKNEMEEGMTYTVEVTPIDGNPDAYVYAFDGNFDFVRGSDNQGLEMDITSGTIEDMTDGDTRLYFAIFGRTASTFKIEIFEEAEEDIVFVELPQVTLEITMQDGREDLSVDGKIEVVAVTNQAHLIENITLFKMGRHDQFWSEVRTEINAPYEWGKGDSDANRLGPNAQLYDLKAEIKLKNGDIIDTGLVTLDWK